MGPALGQADSFNSSGATIVPDHNDNGLRYPTRSRLSAGNGRDQNVPALVAHARMLMPDDTLGRELGTMTGMDGGGLGDDGLHSGQDWSLGSNLDNATPFNSQSTPPIQLTFSGLLNIPSSPPPPSNELYQPESEQHSVDVTSQFDAHFPASSTFNHFANFESFRPTSAQSEYNSNSEYSLSATDMDDDSEMSDSIPQLHGRNDHLGVGLDALNMAVEGSAPVQSYWIAQPQLAGDMQSSNSHTAMPHPRRTVAPDSVSPRDKVSSTGPIRGVRVGSQDPDRIEHRRHINRKSARKSRQKRKDQIEALELEAAERDHEIALLKRDLAVEKAKVGQLAELVRNSGISFGSQPVAW